ALDRGGAERDPPPDVPVRAPGVLLEQRNDLVVYLVHQQGNSATRRNDMRLSGRREHRIMKSWPCTCPLRSRRRRSPGTGCRSTASTTSSCGWATPPRRPTT